MNISLPIFSGLDVQALSRAFSSTTTSYKFVFLQAVLNICSQRGFVKFDGKISCHDLAIEMAAFAWYPHTFHRLTFGRQDELGNILDTLAFSVEGKALTSKFTGTMLRAELKKNYQKIGLYSLLRHVPYRFLSPFFEVALRGLPDQKKAATIRHLADQSFNSASPALYRLINENSEIEIHPKWLLYLQNSFGIVNGWLDFNWIFFLQKRNPNIPAIALKIYPPKSRSSLNIQIKYWRRIMEVSEIHCIYSGQLLKPTNFEVDHFVPWSFICHDQAWNLVPVLPEANSSKGSRLPELKYVDRFIKLQSECLHRFKSQLSTREWTSHIESYIVDLHLSEQDVLKHEKLSAALFSTLSPIISLAKQSGFSSDWKYSHS
jgi:hypothetical protein